jgi:hypothetical protein
LTISRSSLSTLFVLGVSVALGGGVGCTTEAYCFADCEGEGATAGAAGATAAGGSAGQGQGGSVPIGGSAGNAGSGIEFGGQAGSTSGCTATTEICDGKDNDCDGVVDNVDFTKPANCGNCATNCLAGPTALQGTTTPVCLPPATPGGPGTCSYTACADEYFDLDGNKANGCEFRCTGKTADDDKVCNNRDDDCDNEVDEDVDFCAAETCGSCSPCSALNAKTTCVKADATKATCKGNATCQISGCEPGFVDANNSYADGCELPCTPTDNPAEVCDGLDNDCNGSIDDVGAADPKVGQECFGDGVTPVIGECGAGVHAGTYACKAGQYTCEGPNVLLPDTATEICDGKDNDCDGLVDESFPNAGAACGGVGNGQSLGLCKAGTIVCVAGAESCVGTSGPEEEICDGQDNDCDDVIDGTIVGTAVDCTADATVCKPNETCQPRSSNPTAKVCAESAKGVGAACNDNFQPPPAGLISACKAGVTACQGGVSVCVGSVEPPPAGVDACGIDVNCDGVASAGSQPNLQTDPNNCGACGKQCGFVNNVAQICVQGVCQNDPNPQACQPGFISCDGGTCNRVCVKQSDQEICNNVDDDCDCRIDELASDTGDPKDISVPNAAVTCGSGNGLDNECKGYDAATNPQGVTVKCESGKITCTFKNGYCAAGDCAATPDDCDGKDNNCNGVADEAYRNLGSQSLGTKCFSDDGKPFPGDGACRKTGTYICATAKTTKCSVKDAPFTCGSGPNGNGKACDEDCDGVDNDCDGAIDEPKTAPGSNAAYYVKPATVKTGTGRFVQAYESSRPQASGTSADSGNGYFSDAPAGATLDRTYACSEKDVLPWFLVTPTEVEQTCASIGGHICSTKDWQAACRSSTGTCKYGYATSCTSSGPTKCNLDVGNDGDSNLATTGKHPTSCYASFGADGAAFDVTGNLREITRCQIDGAPCGTAAECATNCCSATTSTAGGGVRVCGSGALRIVGSACTSNTQCIGGACSNGYCGGKRGRGVACTATSQCLDSNCVDGFCGGDDTLPGATYPVVGGAFSTGSEDGATCDFTFYKVNATFKLYDTGFRCCYDSDPRLAPEVPVFQDESVRSPSRWAHRFLVWRGQTPARSRRRRRHGRPATRATNGRPCGARPRNARSKSTTSRAARSSRASPSRTSKSSRTATPRPGSSTCSTARRGRRSSPASSCSTRETSTSSRCSTRPHGTCVSCCRSRSCLPSR